MGAMTENRALGPRLVVRAMELAAQGQSFEELFEQTLQTAEAERPSEIWSEIRAVDRGTDVDRLSRWAVQRLDEQPPPPHLSALWFGLYETMCHTHPETAEAVLEINGGPGFPDDPEWLYRQDWCPEGYAPTPGLRSLLRIGDGRHNRDEDGLVSYGIVFVYALGLVMAAIETTDPTLLLGGRVRLGIAMGFHDGDIARLGVLTSAGLDRSGIGWA